MNEYARVDKVQGWLTWLATVVLEMPLCDMCQ